MKGLRGLTCRKIEDDCWVAFKLQSKETLPKDKPFNIILLKYSINSIKIQINEGTSDAVLHLILLNIKIYDTEFTYVIHPEIN